MTNFSSSPSPHRLIIVGAGPAGLTAAIYSARAGLSPLVFESSVEAGGALMNTTEVENYPGFSKGIMGPVLMEEMREQAVRFGAQIFSEDVEGLLFEAGLKTVFLGGGDSYSSRALIFASGSAHRKLGLAREDELSGRGVSWCATCDGFFHRGKPIIVVGGGDSAIEEALFLSKFGSSVTLLVRRGELRASQVLQERLFASTVQVRWHTLAVELVGDSSLEAVVVEGPDGRETLPASGFFQAIGHDPRSTLVDGLLPLDSAGYVLRSGLPAHGQTSTSVDGVFVAGDVADHRYRQAITAAGSGCQAALDAERWLDLNG